MTISNDEWCDGKLGCGEVVEEILEQRFRYGAGEDAVLFVVNVPVMRCTLCNQQWTDERGELIRSTAVEEYKLKMGL